MSELKDDGGSICKLNALANFQETLDGLIYEFTKCDTRSFS